MEPLSGLEAALLQQRGNTFGHLAFTALYQEAGFRPAGPYHAIRECLEDRAI